MGWLILPLWVGYWVIYFLIRGITPFAFNLITAGDTIWIKAWGSLVGALLVSFVPIALVDFRGDS